jgi:hypothetical protein
MSELTSLHPFDPVVVARYVAALKGNAADVLSAASDWTASEIDRARRGYARSLEGSEAGANAVSYGLGRLLGTMEPLFLLPGLGLTQLEAKYDRGAGMLLRPPSRLFADAGLEIAAARAMPIRLDASAGSMGGAFVPPVLVPQFRDLLQRRTDRLARRIAEAELDAPAYVGALLEAADYAAGHGFGLYEAVDVVVPGVPESEPPGLRLIVPDRGRLDRDLRKRLEAAARPPREPGLLARLFGRGGPSRRDDLEPERPWRGMSDVTPPPETPGEETAGEGWRA